MNAFYSFLNTPNTLGAVNFCFCFNLFAEDLHFKDKMRTKFTF